MPDFKRFDRVKYVPTQGLWVLPAEIETLIWLDLAESDLAIKLKGVQS